MAWTTCSGPLLGEDRGDPSEALSGRTLLTLILAGVGRGGLGAKPRSAPTLFLTAQVPCGLPSAACSLGHRFAPGRRQGAWLGERPTEGCWLAPSQLCVREEEGHRGHARCFSDLNLGAGPSQAALSSRRLLDAPVCQAPALSRLARGTTLWGTVSREKKNHVKPSAPSPSDVSETDNRSPHTLGPGGPDAHSAGPCRSGRWPTSLPSRLLFPSFLKNRGEGRKEVVSCQISTVCEQ